MLVLSRHELESVVMPGLGIKIQVIEIRGDKVRIGIEAPRDVVVHREEIWAKIREKQEGGGTNDA